MLAEHHTDIRCEGCDDTTQKNESFNQVWLLALGYQDMIQAPVNAEKMNATRVKPSA